MAERIKAPSWDDERERERREAEIERRREREGSEAHKMFRASSPSLPPAAPSPANIFLILSPLQCHLTARKGDSGEGTQLKHVLLRNLRSIVHPCGKYLM